MRLRIYENFRVPSYAPCYLAHALGLFEREGLDVEIRVSPDPVETAEGLLAGRVDVSWGGPMRVMLHHDRDPDCPLVCFCKVVGPEPFVLVGKPRAQAFDLTQLAGLKLGAVSEVPTPWQLLQEDLRRVGLDPDGIERGPGRSMADNIEAMLAGDIDVAQVMEPYIDLALQRGASLWHAFAQRGDVAFTSFYTTRDFAAANAQACQRLSRAVRSALQTINTAPVGELAAQLAGHFPDHEQTAIERMLQRYRDLSVWPTDTRIGAPSFVRLKLALLSGGFISRDVAFARAVDDTLSA